MNSVDSPNSRVTRKFTNCLRCNKPLFGRQEKFCSDACRWDFHNDCRLGAEKDLLMLIYKLCDKYGIGTYEVKKKER